MKWIRNQKIIVKLLGSLLIFSIMIIGVALIGFSSINDLRDIYVDNYNNNVMPAEYFGVANAYLNQIRAEVYYMMLFPEDLIETEKEIDFLVTAIDEQFSLYGQTVIDESEQAVLDEILTYWTTYKGGLDEVIQYIELGNTEKARLLIRIGTGASARENTSALLSELSQEKLSFMHTQHLEVRSTAQRTGIVLVVIGGIAAIFALFVGTTISRDIVQPLSKGVKMMKELSIGNINTRLNMERKDEIGELTRAMDIFAQTLQQIIDQTRDSVTSTTSATSEILASTNQFTASANEQSAAISQTTTIVDEVYAVAEQAAKKADKVAKASLEAVTVSEDGTESVKSLKSGMLEINEKVQAIAQDILALSEQSQMIGEIIATVNDIADQSNMLALNATIEAAKAGEQGKGFAVVANEVSNLAAQSKQATQNVRSILGDIQKATNAAVLATEQGTKGVETGMTLVQQTGEVIEKMYETVRESAQSAQQIAASAQQQSIGMEQITQAMKDINQATVQFVSGAHQSQTAAENLNEMAKTLQESVRFFKE